VRNIFTEHPHSIGETYFKHLYFASKFGFKMIMGGLACCLHAIFPFAFKNTGSNLLLRMTHDFVSRMPVADERIHALARTVEKKTRPIQRATCTEEAGQ
jgi:hypothetical protein